MITSFFITLFIGLISAVSLILPTSTLPIAVSNGISSIVSYMYVVNQYFPIDTLLILSGLALTLQISIIAWNLAHMVLRYIRGN